MPHVRNRYLSQNLKKLTTFSPLVGVLGHRQVGKTTLLSHFSRDYHTLDVKELREQANKNPDQFVESLKGKLTVIDEAQLAPDLFSALKERVRKNQHPGQFILSGSVRFTSKKTIRESLTGRIQYLELLPFSIAELEHEPLPDMAHRLLETSRVDILIQHLHHDQKSHKTKGRHIEAYLKHGGLPGLAFIRNEVAQRTKMEDQIRTILDRDLRQIHATPLSYDRLLDFCGALAANQGSSIHYSDIQKQTGLSPQTQQKLIYALESVFVVRRLPIEGGMKGFTLLFEDQGESYYFTKNSLDRSIQLTHLLFRNIRTEFFYRLEKDVQFFQYRTRAGVFVPLALRSHEKVIGFIPINGAQPTREEKAAGDSFLRAYRDSKVIFFHEGAQSSAIDDRMIVLPITQLV